MCIKLKNNHSVHPHDYRTSEINVELFKDVDKTNPLINLIDLNEILVQIIHCQYIHFCSLAHQSLLVYMYMTTY